MVFQGDYSSLVIDNCRKVILANVRSRRIMIDRSEVSIESSYFESESSPVVTIRDSLVVITGSEFKGRTRWPFTTAASTWPAF